MIMIPCAGVSVNQTLQGGWSPLMYACSMGHPDLVDVLLKEGANPNFHKGERQLPSSTGQNQ